MIEFADPGYNWAFVWWPVTLLVASIVAVVILWHFIEDAASLLLIPFITAMIFVPIIGLMEYDSRVDRATASELETVGFSNVDVSKDRFTAATEDGQFFSGILVDLRPESGYAYQVLEITTAKP